MPVQDDAREREMVQLFNLSVAEDRKRADIDAQLIIDGHEIDFELKSTTTKSVSTVRDFGPDHIKKWRDGIHWIFAFYTKASLRLDYCIYVSPADMEPWISEKERYILPDLMIADKAPLAINGDDVVAILGEKEVYSYEDARSIFKNQWNKQNYIDFQDEPGGYSLEQITEIMRLRTRYVIERGATLNNPHIPGKFFEKFEKIRSEHAATLRSLVKDYLTKTSATDLPTA